MFLVLVGMKGGLMHVHRVAAVQWLLGSSCAGVQLAGAEAVGIYEDEDREYFVTARCVHHCLIPDEKILIILEVRVPHNPGILFLREQEAVQTHLSTLCYLAHLRLIEY